ncbi:hypothetical protein AG0111_0g11841 [Alternaria gaisen]|uniref:Uncharacterized protein n=1 Tax=Alternaria gaisen TaxID=167740 RepID=A0ACB6F5S1_9PLEO|nr:hypothetical protein AG0111_0g11841 [Alternaria gaisen]
MQMMNVDTTTDTATTEMDRRATPQQQLERDDI